MELSELLREDQTQHPCQFEQDVQGKGCPVFQRLPHFRTDPRGFVRARSTDDYSSVLFRHLARFDEFVRAVPGTPAVGARNGQVQSAHDDARDESSHYLGAEGKAQPQREDDRLNRVEFTMRAGRAVWRMAALAET